LNILQAPLLTHVHQSASDFKAVPGAAYVFARSPEDRSLHVDAWRSQRPDVLLIEIVEQGRSSFLVSEASSVMPHNAIALRSRIALANFWQRVEGRRAYLDITGLAHHIWAPLLRSALESAIELRGVYVEPSAYRPSKAPVEGAIFDLSESVGGLGPLPGFATLARLKRENSVFVPLLGFEGARFAQVTNEIEPTRAAIFPIVGLPGFRPEYPYFTLIGNQRKLVETGAWERIVYATANCPFSAFLALEEIRSQESNKRLVIAPIGTKPHALGAVLYKIRRTEETEIVYDFPVRKTLRTSGADRLAEYAITDFLAEIECLDIS
jgi:hypothetical protein